jgi:hypothetical protein
MQTIRKKGEGGGEGVRTDVSDMLKAKSQNIYEYYNK